METISLYKILGSKLTSNYLDDLELVANAILDEMDIYLVFKTNIHFEIDFTGYTHGDLTYLENKLSQESTGLFTFSFKNTCELGISRQNTINISEMLSNFINTKIQLNELRQYLMETANELISKYGSCEFDCSSQFVKPNLNGNNSGINHQVTQFEIKPNQINILILMIELIIHGNGKIKFVGISNYTLVKLQFAMNYFTLPEFSEEEELYKWLKENYEPGDFIFINKLVKPNPKDNHKFEKADFATSHVQLGVITDIVCEYDAEFMENIWKINYRPFQISQNRLIKDGKLFTTTSGSLVNDIHSINSIHIFARWVSIHGVELCDECEDLFKYLSIAIDRNSTSETHDDNYDAKDDLDGVDIKSLSNVKFKERRLYYNSCNVEAYRTAISPKEKTVKHRRAFSQEALKEATRTETTMRDISEIL